MTLNATLYAALVQTAQNIAEHDARLGRYAARKVEHVSAASDLPTLIRTGEDIQLIARLTVLKVVRS